MSSENRAALFDDDLSDFQPGTPARMNLVRDIAERAGFRSREPKVSPASSAQSPGSSRQMPREPRRYRTGRNQQLNLKVRAEDAGEFYAIADSQGWVLGEAFARAIAALKKELEGSPKAT